MTKFKFRLEAALRFRRMRLEAETVRLQELLAQKHRLEKLIVDLREEGRAAFTFVESASNTGSQDLRALSLFGIGLTSRARTTEEAIQRLTTLVAEQKERLLEAERAERVLGKLRTKRLAEWDLQNQREIEATAQELWLFSHTRHKDDPGKL